MKKINIFISSILILGFSFIFHSVYDKFPSIITSILFPVNESIFEHNKIIILSYICTMLIYKIKYKNLNIIYYMFISCILCILLEMSIFSFIYFVILNTKENFLIAILTYLISIIISQIYFYKKVNSKYISKFEYKGIYGFIILIIICAYLSYRPIKIPLFYDYNEKIYGIKND